MKPVKPIKLKNEGNTASYRRTKSRLDKLELDVGSLSERLERVENRDEDVGSEVTAAIQRAHAVLEQAKALAAKMGVVL